MLVDQTFISELRWALRHLYNPERLRTSPLMQRFGIGHYESPSALRRILTSAIRALEPDPSTSSDSTAWRTYYTLYHRYVDQFSQRHVAMSLALSIRQMRRQERLALQVLADYLLNHHDLKAEASRDASDPGLAEVNGAEASVVEQELDCIRQSYPSQAVQLTEVMDSLTQVIAPLAQAQRVRVEFSLPEDLPCVAVQLVPLRQAVLSVLTRAIQRVPEGLVQVFAEAVGRQVSIGIRPSSRADTGEPPDANETSDLEIARRLAMLSGGSLEALPGTDGVRPFTATLTLPTVEQALVLFIDDNADTLQLFRRHLEATRHPFVGTRDPKQAIALAEEFTPSIIVLDVMLPGIDGWELLGRLRQHPNTHSIPIIVCSILKEEQLALALGAAAFLAKPVSRTQLIAALDAQLGSHSPECP